MLQPTQRIYREYLVLLNSCMIMKQKFVNISNTRAYENRIKKNAKPVKKVKEKPQPQVDTSHAEAEIINAAKISIHRAVSITDIERNELEHSNSQEQFDINHVEQKSDLEIIIDEFYALK